MAASAARASLAVGTVASKSFIVASPAHLSIALAIRPVNFPAPGPVALRMKGCGRMNRLAAIEQQLDLARRGRIIEIAAMR
jgi:hypothetical protein